MKVEVLDAPIAEVMASGLVAELDQELKTRYPGETIRPVDPKEFKVAGGYFVVAWVSPVYVGCGGFRPYDHRTVELTSMYVRREYRRRGVGRALLHALERQARRRGFGRVVLGTTRELPEAVALYRSAGYAQIEPFGDHACRAYALCFEKRLR